MKYSSDENKLLLYMTWINLTSIMLSEVSNTLPFMFLKFIM